MTLFLQLSMVLLSVQAADIQFSLDPAQVEFTDFMGEEVVYIPGGASPFENGDPALPGIGYSMVIPQGTALENVEVQVLSTVELPGVHRILPVLSLPIGEPIPPVIPRSSSYNGLSFPSSMVHNIHTGNKTGYRIASFTFVPFVWNPGTGALSVVTEARLTPVTATDPLARSLTLTDAQIRTAARGLENMVQNPEMLRHYAPASRGGFDGPPWVVIADEAHQETLQPLVDLRNTTHGSQFVSTQWVYDNYDGRDTQEQIRNYLKDAYENQGLIYALIVGDFGETTRVSQLNIGGNVMNAVADLYYSDLDGDWDSDGDNIFGELNDGLDYYSDIYTGRYSTDVPSRLATMVNRTVAYETTAPSGDWRNTALLAGAGLFFQPGQYEYWGSFVCDSIDLRIPDSWTVHKLYEDYASHPNNQIDLINEGVAYCSPNGHGFQSGIYWYFNPPTDMVSAANYTDLTNNDMPTVFHSIACLAGNIQNIASIAERLMFWPSGGAVAVMFNSENGWGSPPNMGASEWLELYFAIVLFEQEQYEVGVAHALSKDQFKANISIGMQNWVLQENNLLGDPALRFIAGQMGIEEGEEGSGAIAPTVFAPAPNPVSGTCAIGYSMPASGSVQVSVFDITGRVAARVHSGYLGAGQGSLGFDASQLPAGCYSIVMSSPSGVSSAPMLVLR